MAIRSKMVRLLRSLGKALLMVLLLLLVVILGIHIPAVQQMITRKVATTLSSKFHTKVSIEKIRFSLLGHIAVEGLEVQDTSHLPLLLAGKIKVEADPLDLLQGHWIVQQILLQDVSGHLVQSEAGMNIDFILDAFPSDSVPATPASPFNLKCNQLIAENISLEYVSLTDRFSFHSSISHIQMDSLGWANLPDRLHASSISIDQPTVNILYQSQTQDTTTSTASPIAKSFTPDFGAGFAIALGHLQIREGTFTSHQDSIQITPTFDFNHINLQHITADLGRSVLSPQLLLAAVDSLSIEMPNYGTSTLKGRLSMSPTSMTAEGLHFTSAGHQLDGLIRANYITKAPSHDTLLQGDGEIISSMTTSDLAYFLDKDIMTYFKGLEKLGLSITGSFNQKDIFLESLTLSSKNSRITGAGQVENILTPEKLAWKNLQINASIGNDLRNLLTSFVDQVPIPPSINIQMLTTGHPGRMSMDGKMNTSWGSAVTRGTVSPSTGQIGLDMHIIAQDIQTAQWLELPWLGQANAAINLKGTLGDKLDLSIDGKIQSLAINGTTIHDIDVSGGYEQDIVAADLVINDTLYRCQIKSATTLGEPLTTMVDINFDSTYAGQLAGLDSTLRVNGNMMAKVILDDDTLEAMVIGLGLDFQNQFGQYHSGRTNLDIAVSPQSSMGSYQAEDANFNLEANFDLREATDIFSAWPSHILLHPDSLFAPNGTRILTASASLHNDSIFHLLPWSIDTFSGLNFTTAWNEPDSLLTLDVQAGKLSAMGWTMDTLAAHVQVDGQTSMATASLDSLGLGTTTLGDLSLSLQTPGDTIASHIILQKDTTQILGLNTRILASGSSYQIFPDALIVLGTTFNVDPRNPIEIRNNHIFLNDFTLGHDDMHLSLTGDSSSIKASFDHVDLSRLNALLFPDSALIHKADLNGHLVYDAGKQLDLKANIDSLILYHSRPFSLAINATTDLNEVPFSLLLTGGTNKLELKGKYLIDAETIDASLITDIPDAESFTFLTKDYLDTLQGSIKGKAHITGPLEQPELNGKLFFKKMDIHMVYPPMNFYIPDDSIALNHNELRLDSFRVLDHGQRPLLISGKLSTPDYNRYSYNFDLFTDKYALLDNAKDQEAILKGLFMVGTKTNISGNEKDTYVKSDLKIDASTNLIYTYPSSGTELTNTKGIIEFVDPAALSDTTLTEASGGSYDSLIALLPDFVFNSTVKVDSLATLKIIVDAQSGDYLEASGGGKLDINYDRTGNLDMSGTYTVVKGIYRLSFYDLVKKNFTIVPGSSINWIGNPRTGDLDIKAVYNVSSNSIGLIGNEIGENEKSIYKRTLEYEIGIHIKGTLEKPNVYFTLDLPDQEKANYPVLANKLDRLQQPEFQSELNKQVFGLLVLGGFLPESSASDINSNQIATTALYNSVNSVLTAQLNRFAGQYLKGVNIDVGIQSYSDYSTPGSKTQTAMDFRVSKSILDDRLSFEVGGDFDINSDQSGANTGNNYRGDVAIIYDLTGNGDKKLKLFNNETYDIVYQEIRNTGISLIFIREFNKGEKAKRKTK